jgi:5-methylcytosine-specific restriction endonuclease McrA
MKELLSAVFDGLGAGSGRSKVWSSLIARPEFAYLRSAEQDYVGAQSEGAPHGSFPTAAKNAGLLAQFLPQAPRCPLCGGLMHRNGMTVDHKDEKAKGGSSANTNARMVHPICNSDREINEREAAATGN